MYDLTIITDTDVDFDIETMKKHAEIVLRSECAENDVELSIVLCDSDQMRQYNRQYRGQDKATDVLSFRYDESIGFPKQECGSKVIGDIVIDINQVNRQKGTSSFEMEFLSVLVHGILHLMGYDHVKISDRYDMEQKERKYSQIILGDKHSG